MVLTLKLSLITTGVSTAVVKLPTLVLNAVNVGKTSLPPVTSPQPFSPQFSVPQPGEGSAKTPAALKAVDRLKLLDMATVISPCSFHSPSPQL